MYTASQATVRYGLEGSLTLRAIDWYLYIHLYIARFLESASNWSEKSTSKRPFGFQEAFNGAESRSAGRKRDLSVTDCRSADDADGPTRRTHRPLDRGEIARLA